jgi:hypothetical protein
VGGRVSVSALCGRLGFSAMVSEARGPLRAHAHCCPAHSGPGKRRGLQHCSGGGPAGPGGGGGGAAPRTPPPPQCAAAVAGRQFNPFPPEPRRQRAAAVPPPPGKRPRARNLVNSFPSRALQGWFNPLTPGGPKAGGIGGPGVPARRKGEVTRKGEREKGGRDPPLCTGQSSGLSRHLTLRLQSA